MLTVNISIKGTTQEIARLRRLGDSLFHMRSAMEQLGQELDNYFATRPFASQGGIFGSTWRALSDSTRSYKSKHYRAYANAPLRRTGLMSRSFIYDADDSSVIIGNDAPYFKYHQSILPRRKLPRRQMLGVTSGVKSLVKQVIQADVQAKLRRVE